VCVFFWGVGGNFCHKKLPEAEVRELRGTNLRTEEGKINVGFKVLRVMVIKTAVFWDVMICSLVDRYISMGLPPSSLCYKDGGNRRR